MATTHDGEGYRSRQPNAERSVDRLLQRAEIGGACCFAIGLVALLVGATWLGIALWASSLWFDWRIASRVEELLTAAGSDDARARTRDYVRGRSTRVSIAQGIAIVVGVVGASGGHIAAAIAIWLIAGTGIALNRSFVRRTSSSG